MNFADLGLSDELLKAVVDSGYTVPTPIQEQAIPQVHMMRDIIAIAQTGTGKTASFVLPMIDILANGRRRALMPRSLILEPTRELAAQVAENFEKYGKNHDLKMALLIGGVQMGDQVKALADGVDVLIATPGRLMDLFERGKIMLNGCSMLVIDEADRMLDMGFIPDIENICTKLPATRQTLLFSATMPPPIKKLADRFLTNPKYIEVARPATANVNIAQFKVAVPARKKRDVLRQILQSENVQTGIIFCNRKTTVREINKSLNSYGFSSGEIHGDMDQGSRIAELQRFKDGKINILVASDVAARGLDVKGVSHVFNFDTPWHPDDYVHRIGRTGRAGALGRAFTFVAPEDAEAIANVEKLTGGPIPIYDAETASEIATDDTADKAAPEKQEREPKKRGRTPREPRQSREPRAERAPRDERKHATREDAAQEQAFELVSDASAASPEPVPVPERTRRAPSRDSSIAEPRQERRPRRGEQDGPDDGWNGPIPDFLNASALN